MQNKAAHRSIFRSVHLCSLAFLSLLLTQIASVSSSAAAEDKTGRSPLDELPPHIKQVTPFGQRADWSHDGKRILLTRRDAARQEPRRDLHNSTDSNEATRTRTKQCLIPILQAPI